MLDSKHKKPSCYIECRADLTDLVKIRKKYCKAVKLRVSTNDFIICAIARAIEKYPLMAGRITKDGKQIHITEDIGVGFAVAAPQGLVVPIVKKSTRQGLFEIGTESEQLLEKARSNRLMPDDFDGANVVLSGLGMYGISSFIAISPPLACGIIAIGRIEDTAIPANNEIKIRKMMSMTLTADQRIVNEFYAAAFLRCVIDQLESPKTLTGDFS